MCGIVAVVGERIGQRESTSSTLKRGMDAIAARGPDGEGYWSTDYAAFGHKRLAIVDPDVRSKQPMESENWTLCYNGEIYNFRDLRQQLIQLGYAFSTTSDTEVLLVSLEAWGIEGALSRIAGMFAFIACNKRTKYVYAARDHMGIKPLLYSRDAAGVWYFASSVAAIRKMRSDTQFEINRAAVASFFALGGAHIRQSCYEGIDRLDAAHFMTIAPDGTCNIQNYWRPKFQADFSMGDLIEIVKEYAIADVKSALFLSGGVDSTFLASVVQELDCFHLVSPEESYARLVAERFDRKLVSVRPDLNEYECDVEKATAFHGEPLMSLGIPLAVSRRVREHGYKMAISANGADELFLGYRRTVTPEYTPQYMPLHEEQSYKYLSEQLSHIFRDERNFVIPALEDVFPTMKSIHSGVVEHFYLEGFPPSASFRWTELMTYVLSDLNPTLDAASMYNSVEVRVPFLDHRIVQGVLSWGGEKLIVPELGRKAPLKKHLARYFPQSLYQRPKLGFSIHADELASISDLSEASLRDAMKEGALKLSGGRKFGEFERDLIYLGSCFFGYSKWEHSDGLKLAMPAKP